MERKTEISFDIWKTVEKALQRLVMNAQQNKKRRATTQAALLLIWSTFFPMIERRPKNRLKKEICIFVKILYWLKIGLFLVISDNFMLSSLLSKLFTYKVFKSNLIKQIFRTEATSESFWDGKFPNQLETLFKN